LLRACAEALGCAPAVVPQPATATAAGSTLPAHARLLLVEDNEINCDLAVELLGRIGLQVDIARNGREAIERLQRSDYDAVLMDCQMPEMDGFEATRRLRQEPRWRDLPIIAMTANAMLGDREKALAAGMNDHVAKPINVPHLYATIARWVKPRTAAAGRAGAATPRPELDREAAMARLDGNAALLQRALDRFAAQYQDFRPAFDALRRAGDASAARRMAHDLQSLAGTQGLPAFQEAALALEQACAAGVDGERFDLQVHEVAAQLASVIAEITPAPSPASP
jgi:CheY-like chemotaxis protein